MRGKGLSELAHTKKARITPACAGKTLSPALRVSAPTDHPRVCGENGTRASKKRAPCGSPPRMRGKPSKTKQKQAKARITPAHAGKTHYARPPLSTRTDHPRACGENKALTEAEREQGGSPPRMRGKRENTCPPSARGRITPAHAGKTTSVPLNNPLWTDHPRACGENASIVLYFATLVGSPPRMRGKRIRYSTSRAMRRITPAHAGKTTPSRTRMAAISDHPRVCGENKTPKRWMLPSSGSPPRVRGKLSGETKITFTKGITPACAGKTYRIQFRQSPCWDHPRVCGENFGFSTMYFLMPGSPPRVRGKLFELLSDKVLDGITPACAGKTPRCSASRCSPQDHPRVCGENRSAGARDSAP